MDDEMTMPHMKTRGPMPPIASGRPLPRFQGCVVWQPGLGELAAVLSMLPPHPLDDGKDDLADLLAKFNLAPASVLLTVAAEVNEAANRMRRRNSNLYQTQTILRPRYGDLVGMVRAAMAADAALAAICTDRLRHMRLVQKIAMLREVKAEAEKRKRARRKLRRPGA
jgi:hypothetical protein